MEPVNCPAIQCKTLLLLVVALVDCPRNTRTFEKLDGLLTVTTLFRSGDTSRAVKLKLVEFVYFYLMPEAPSLPRAASRVDSAAPAVLQRSPSKLAKAFDGSAAAPTRQLRPKRSDGGDEYVLSTEEKTRKLSMHLPNVEDLVRDLRVNNNSLFNGVMA